MGRIHVGSAPREVLFEVYRVETNALVVSRFEHDAGETDYLGGKVELVDALDDEGAVDGAQELGADLEEVELEIASVGLLLEFSCEQLLIGQRITKFLVEGSAHRNHIPFRAIFEFRWVIAMCCFPIKGGTYAGEKRRRQQVHVILSSGQPQQNHIGHKHLVSDLQFTAGEHLEQLVERHFVEVGQADEFVDLVDGQRLESLLGFGIQMRHVTNDHCLEKVRFGSLCSSDNVLKLERLMSLGR